MIKVFRRPSVVAGILATAAFSFLTPNVRGQDDQPATGSVTISPTGAADTTPASSISSAEAISPSPTSAVPSDLSGSSLFSLPYIPLTISLSVHGGYDDNFRTDQSAHGSWFTSGGLSALYSLPGTATQVTFHGGGNITYYPDQSGGGQANNVTAFVNGTIIHNVSERLKLDATVYATYRTEPDFASNVGSDSQQGNFFQTLDSLKATYNWSLRFSTVTSDKFQLVNYDDAQSAALNRIENTIGQEFRYDVFHKGNTLVAEYRFEIVDYQSSPRDSLTSFALAGFNEEFSPQLKLTFRGGASFRDYIDDGSRIDPYLESSLSYAGAHDSLLSWKTTYGVEEPSATDVLSRTTFRTGLEFKYSFTARIIGTLNAYYHHDDNQGAVTTPSGGSSGTSSGNSTGSTGSSFTENSFDVFADGRYIIGHRWSFDLGFEYSGIKSGVASRDYTRTRTSAGVTYNF